MRTEKQKRHDYFRAKENASKYHWDRMTKQEREWLIAFEVSEYEAERGHVTEAVDALSRVGVTPNNNYIQTMRERHATTKRVNPQNAETTTKNQTRKTNQKRTANMYDSADYVRVAPGKILKDDIGFDAVYSKAEAEQAVEGSNEHTEGHLADKIYKPFKVEAGLNPDETACMINPEDGMIEAIDHAAKKNRSLEKLIEDAKLSKEAKELLEAKTQRFEYAATTYSKHANLILDMNFILRAPNGVLWVQDQHGRLQTMELYLKRRTSESVITHAEVSFPETVLQVWVFKPGAKSNIEGKAVKI